MALDYNTIILLVILGAAAVGLCAYAVARTWGGFRSESEEGFSDQQKIYMASVRERNFEFLRWTLRRGSKQDLESTRSFVVRSENCG